MDAGLEKLTSMRHKLNIVKEERATGSVAGNVYIAYIRASKSWFPMVAFLFLQLSRLVSEIMMMLAQANWATHSFNHEDSEEYLEQCGIYLVIHSLIIITFLKYNFLIWTYLILFIPKYKNWWLRTIRYDAGKVDYAALVHM